MTRAKNGAVLIRVDGSHEIGLGHIYRMRTLAAALRDDGFEVAFLTLADRVANRLLEATGLVSFVFQTAEYAARRRQALDEHQPGLIIQDVLQTSPAEMAALREESSARIVNFDDVGAGLHAADAVINSIVFAWNAYSSRQVAARLYEGPRYMILQPGIERYARMEKAIPELAGHLLVAFGGTDTRCLTERALAALNQVDAALEVTVNLGPGAEETPGLRQALAASPHRARLSRASPDLPGECYNADLVLCAGGVMLYELAAIGVPSVAIAAEKHELHTLGYWSAVGSTRSLGWAGDLDAAALVGELAALIRDRRRREGMSRCGKQSMDGQGLARVLAVLREVAA